MSFRVRLRSVFGRLDVRSIEILFLGLTFSWGTWLVMPWATFDASPTFRIPAYIAREEAWGAAGISIGTCRLCGLLFGNYPLRIFAAAGGCGVWWTTWVGIAMHDWRSTGVPIYMVLSVFCGYCLFSLIREFRRERASPSRRVPVAGVAH